MSAYKKPVLRFDPAGYSASNQIHDATREKHDIEWQMFEEEEQFEAWLDFTPGQTNSSACCPR